MHADRSPASSILDGSRDQARRSGRILPIHHQSSRNNVHANTLSSVASAPPPCIIHRYLHPSIHRRSRSPVDEYSAGHAHRRLQPIAGARGDGRFGRRHRSVTAARERLRKGAETTTYCTIIHSSSTNVFRLLRKSADKDARLSRRQSAYCRIVRRGRSSIEYRGHARRGVDHTHAGSLAATHRSSSRR